MKTFRVHTLVGNYFLMKDYSKKGLTVNHKDGNRTNNHIDNLELLTSKENNLHARENKLCFQHGEKSIKSKLTNEQAKKIRELKKNSDITYVKLGEIYNMSSQAISNIVNNKSYRDDV